MKKTLAAFLALCMVLCLAACSKTPEPDVSGFAAVKAKYDAPAAAPQAEESPEETPPGNYLDENSPIPADNYTGELTEYISETNELRLMLPEGVTVTEGEVVDYRGHLLVSDDGGAWAIRFEPFVYSDTLIYNLGLSDVFQDRTYKTDWSKDVPTTLAGFPARVWANNNSVYIQSMYDSNHPAVDIVLDYGDTISGPWNGLYIRLIAQEPTTETNIYDYLYLRAVRAILNNFEVIETADGAEYAGNGFSVRFPTTYWVMGSDMLTGATRGIDLQAGVSVGTIPSTGDPQATAAMFKGEVFEKTYGDMTWYGTLIETARTDSEGNSLPSTYSAQLYAPYSDNRCQSAYVNVQGFSAEQYMEFLDGDDMTMILGSVTQDPASWQDSSKVSENGFTASKAGELQKYDGPGGDVEIPSEVGGVAITAIKGFMNNNDITSVVIPEGVTVILSDAFRNCTNLKTVVMPDTVIEIRNNAFHDCENLESVTFSGSLMTMEWNVFDGCAKLRDVVLPDSLTAVPENTFREAGVGTFTGPGAVYGYSCFQGSGFDTITIGEGADLSADNIFRLAAASEINLPDGLTKLGEGAFMNCENLAELTIPASVTELGEGCFANVHISGTFKTSLPEGIEVLPRNCFIGTDISVLTIPASVTRIEEGAIDASVAFLMNPNVELADRALAVDYLSLNGVYTPEQAPQNLGNQFDFRQVYLPMDATIEETLAFDSYLLSVGKSDVTWLGISSEFYPDDIENYTQDGHWITGYTGTSENLYIPVSGEDPYNSIWRIQDGAFAGNTTITSVSLGVVDEIHSKVFDGCVNLKDIWVPGSWIDSIKKDAALASDAFAGLPDGVAFHFPESWTTEERLAVEQAFADAGMPDTAAVEYYSLRDGGATAAAPAEEDAVPAAGDRAPEGAWTGLYTKFVGDPDSARVEDEPFSLDLNADGTGVHHRDDMDFNVTWTLDGDQFTMTETFIGDPIVYVGTLSEGKLDIFNGDPDDMWSCEYVYEK